MEKIDRAKKYPQYYFKNGHPKKAAMTCKSKAYIREIKANYGDQYNPAWVCAGSSCPLYALGCKD